MHKKTAPRVCGTLFFRVLVSDFYGRSVAAAEGIVQLSNQQPCRHIAGSYLRDLFQNGDGTAVIAVGIDLVAVGTAAGFHHDAQKTEAALRKVAESTMRAEEKVREISEACARQARSTDQINEHISQITAVVQENSALAEETAATCEELSAQTQSMDMLMRKFRVNSY